MNGLTPKGPWSSDQIDGFLEETVVPLRLACTARSGHPTLASLWFLPAEGRLWCATQETAKVASFLATDPRCAFEVSLESPPYQGVRGKGLATLHQSRAASILPKLIDRYLGHTQGRLATSLLSRLDTETAISIEATSLFAWDYQERMSDD